jgi:hypothetical protein
VADDLPAHIRCHGAERGQPDNRGGRVRQRACVKLTFWTVKPRLATVYPQN